MFSIRWEMELKPGSRWKSAVCATEVAIVRPAQGIVLECGGHGMAALGAAPPPSTGTIAAANGPGTLLGKRYFDEDSGLEVLCTKPGAGSLSVDGRAMALREAKRLPSSD